MKSQIVKIDKIKGLIKFLLTEPASVLSVPIDKEGTIHSAGLLFAFDPESFEFIFITSSKTEKCKLLLKEKQVKASCVIGTQKGVPYSLQMRGVVRLKEYNTAQEELNLYEKKFGKKFDDMSDSDQVVLIFEPNWARYTDYVSTDWKDGYKRIQIELK